jgi:putative Mg2+ transporter-C (MgtC) family protein
MDSIHEWPDASAILRVATRLAEAALLGGVIGFEREVTGKAAGLRTHILVALGAAIFVVAPLESGMTVRDVATVVQGVAAGIGFIGAGAILKLDAEKQIHGLTTAATIWFTASVGVAVGLGRVWLGGIAVLFTLALLLVARKFTVEGKLPGAAGANQ